MGNTLGTHIGNTLVRNLEFGSWAIEGHREGVGCASTSEASRGAANTLVVRKLLHGWFHPRRYIFQRLAKPSSPSHRAHATGIQIPQLAQQHIAEVNAPYLLCGRLESNWVTDKSFADKSFAAPPSDLSIAAHPPHKPCLWISQSDHAGRCPAGLIPFCGRAHVQCLVGTNVVVNPHPPANAALLRSSVGRSWTGRLGLEHPMHLFVCRILLRVPWDYEFDPNPQSCPPRTQTRKARWTDRSKGHPVVHPDRLWIAVLTKKTRTDPLHGRPALIGQNVDGQKITTEHVSDRQRFGPLTVGRAKPSFEVYGPDLVAASRLGQAGPLHMWSCRPVVPPPGQLHAPQPFGDAPHRRNPLRRMLLAQPNPKLLAAPTPMPSPQPAYTRQPLCRNLTGAMMRTARTVTQAAQAFSFEAGHPFVTSLATDSENPTQMRHASRGLQSQFHESQPPSKRRDFFPRHSRRKRQK